MSEPAELSPFDYFRPMWRFKWLVAIVVIAAAGATYWYYERQPKTYETSTEVYVGASDLTSVLGGQQAPQSDRTLANQARLVTTPQVTARVAKDLDPRLRAQALSGSLQVSPNTDSDFLTLVARASSPQAAAALANGYANGYLEVRATNERRSARKAIREIQDQLAELTGNTRRRKALSAQLARLQSATALPPQVGEQLRPAVAPQDPVAPNPQRNAIFAAALALLLGVFAAYLFDRSDLRLRRLGDIEQSLGLELLASMPPVRRAGPPKGEATGISPDLREPFRTLRVSLDIARRAEDIRTLLITSALPAEGKSTVVRNLALAYMEAGRSVAILEADMRRPVLADLFDIDPPSGLSDLLQEGGNAGAASVTVVGERTDRARLTVLVAGTPPENPSALLTSDGAASTGSKFAAVRDELLLEHDIVLVDSPPVLAVSDALAIASQVDGVLVVVRASVSTKATTKRLLKAFRHVPNVRLVGAVANAVKDDLASTAYYGYTSDGKAATVEAPRSEYDLRETSSATS